MFGTSFPVEALVAVSGRLEADVRDGLAELLRREVFEVLADRLSPQRGSYRFTQNLLRQVAYETLSRRDRKVRHLAVAAHLRSTFAGDGDEVIDVIARHYLDAVAAVPTDSDTEAIRTEATSALVRAAERASRAGAPVNAAASYATAAAQMAASARPDAVAVAASLWERAAAEEAIAGDVDLAVERADAAIAHYERIGETRAAARANAIAGRALRSARRHSEAGERLVAALAVLRHSPDADTVSALSELSSIEVLTGGPAADALTTEALVLGQELAVDAHLIAGLFNMRGVWLGFANRNAEARASFEYATRLAAEGAGDGLVLGRALANLSDHLSATDPAAAADAARTAAEHFRRVGAHAMLSLAQVNLAQAMLAVGDWDSAAAVLTTDAAQDGLADSIDIVLSRVLLAGLRGELEVAAELMKRPDFQSKEDPQDVAYALAGSIVVAAAQDQHDVVLRHAAAIPELLGAVRLSMDAFMWAWPLGVRAAETLHDTETLASLSALVDDQPRGHQPPLLRLERDLARARASDEPAPLFAAAISGLRRFGSSYHLAHGLLDHAVYLLGTPESGRAAALIEEAAEVAERLGARPLATRAERVRALHTTQLVD